MWSAIGIATARRLRVGAPVSAVKLLGRLTSRVPRPQAAAPVGRPVSVYVVPRRGYAGASDAVDPPAAATEKKTKKKTTRTKKAATGTKKKAAAKPAKPKGRPKKKKAPLTPEQKQRADKARYKELALIKGQPPKLPVYPRGIFISEIFQTTKPETGQWTRAEVTGTLTKAVHQFNRLPEADRTRLSNIAAANRVANAATMKAWLETFPPIRIYEANQARRRLGLSYLKDDRIPVQRRNAYSFYIKSRFEAGDYVPGSGKSGSLEAVRRMAEEWNKLSEEERKPYFDEAEADWERYTRECEAVFGRQPQARRPSRSKAKSD